MTTAGRARAPRSPALFVGRTAELEAFARHAEQLRLITVYGIAGVGKTSFMLRAAEELARRESARLAYYVCRPGESAGSIAEAVCDQLALDPRPPGSDPVEALIRATDRIPVVLCLDDAHRLVGGLLIDAMVYWASLRLPLWLCIASREALPISPVVVDHLVIRLKGLSSDDSRELLRALSSLYGPPGGRAMLDSELERSAGNPLRLKQLFSGHLEPSVDQGQPFGLLPPLEAELLSLLCAFRRSTPLSSLTGDRDTTAVERALQELTRRFLVEIHDDHAAVHDLVRDLVARSPLAPTIREHGRCLEFYRQRGGAISDAVQMEILYHAILSGADDLAEEILCDHASHLRRVVPVGAVIERELLWAIGDLGSRRPISVPIRLLSARIRARQGQVLDSYEEVKRLAQAHPEDAEPLICLDLGEMAYTLGRLDEAEQALGQVVDSPKLEVFARVLGVDLLAETLRAKGQRARAHQMLVDQAELLAKAGSLGEAAHHWLTAMIAYDHERYAEVIAELGAARRSLEPIPLSIKIPLLRSLERTAEAAMGQPTSERVDPAELFDETLYFRLTARILRAQEATFRGDLRTPLLLCEQTIAQAEEAGYQAIGFWASWLWADAARMAGELGRIAEMTERSSRGVQRWGHARARLRLRAIQAYACCRRGQLAEAKDLVGRALADAQDSPGTLLRLRNTVALADAMEGVSEPPPSVGCEAPQAEGFDAADAKATEVDLLLWKGRPAEALLSAEALTATVAERHWPSIGCRSQRLTAEAEYRLGDYEAAELTCARALGEAQARSYRGEEVGGHLIAAALARVSGDAPRRSHHLEVAARLADEAGLPIEGGAARLALEAGGEPPSRLALKLAERLALLDPLTVRLLEEGRVRWLSGRLWATWSDRRYRFVVDGVGRRVKLGAAWFDLSKQQVVLTLLGVLGASPGRVVSAERLVREVWGDEYHPLKHHSRLTMTISRARKLLGALEIEAHDNGYCLKVDTPWAVASLASLPESSPA